MWSLLFLVSISSVSKVGGGTTDPFQADIAPNLVAKVDDAKEKQISGQDLETAAAELRNVVGERPDYYRALFNLGLIYQKQGKTEQSLETLKQAKQVGDNYHIADASILNSIGWAYMDAGKLDDAEMTLLEASKQSAANKPTDERVLNNLGYLYLQKNETDKARAYLNKSLAEYHSQGAAKVLKLVEEYEQTQMQGAKEIPGLVSLIDSADSQSRLHSVNALAFSTRYPSGAVVTAILQRLERKSSEPLSVQGEINCLTILARRARVAWSDEQLSRAKSVVAALETKQLSPPEQYSVDQLKDALAKLQADANP